MMKPLGRTLFLANGQQALAGFGRGSTIAFRSVSTSTGTTRTVAAIQTCDRFCGTRAEVRMSAVVVRLCAPFASSASFFPDQRPGVRWCSSSNDSRMPKEVAAQSAADTQILEEQARQRRQYEQRMGVSEGSSTSKGYTARSVTLHSSECSGNSSGDGTANSSTKFDGINQVFLHRPSAVERVLLVVALKYFPHEIPSRVNRGVMNNTWSRIRILAACVCWVYLLYWIEMSIRSGRAHRDDGKISLYEDVATSPQQAFKRELSKGKEQIDTPIIAQAWSDLKDVVNS